MTLCAISWDAARLPELTEAQCAEWQDIRGRRPVEHLGRWWMESRPFVFQPVHHLARLTPDEATRPARRCIGFRARLIDDAADRSDACLPAHTLPDPQSYDMSRLSQTPRRYLRQGMRAVDIVALESPDLILDQGYEVASAAHARDPGIGLPPIAQFKRNIESYFPGRGVILAAVRDQRLLGFSMTFAVDRAAYHDMVYVNNEGLAARASICLFHAFATLVSRQPALVEVMHGLHVRDDLGLNEFKRRIGLVVSPLPARAWFAPGPDQFLRRVRPHQYYRFTGRG